MIKIEPTIRDTYQPRNNLITVYRDNEVWFTANVNQIWGNLSKHYDEVGSEEWLKTAYWFLEKYGEQTFKWTLGGGFK